MRPDRYLKHVFEISDDYIFPVHSAALERVRAEFPNSIPTHQ